MSIYGRGHGRGIGDIEPKDIVKSGHFGLANMRDRIERNGGSLEISNGTNSGTKLTGVISVTNRTDIPDLTSNYKVTIKNKYHSTYQVHLNK